MSISIRPLTTNIGAEVEGIDLREPLTPAQAEEIHHGMDRYAVLVFHEQPLTNDQHLAFTQHPTEVDDVALKIGMTSFSRHLSQASAVSAIPVPCRLAGRCAGVRSLDRLRPGP